MTDRETLLRRLDDLVAVARDLDDDGLAAVVGYVLDAVTAATPEPMPDDVAERLQDDGMPDHVIALFEDLADTPYDLAAVDAAAQVYVAAVVAAGGAYGHALAAVWRAWPRHGDDE